MPIVGRGAGSMPLVSIVISQDLTALLIREVIYLSDFLKSV